MYLPRHRKEKPATPEQIKTIEMALGEPIEEFIRTFTDERKRKIFADTLAKKIRQTQWLTTLSSSNGQYQPIYSEQLFQQVNINPAAASSSQIEQWLLSPQYFDQNLRHLSQYLSYAVGQYNRSIYYMNTVKSYKYKLLPSDSDIESNINTDEYLHSYDICLRTLQKMNIRYQIPKVDLITMIDGISFFWVAETDDTISLLQLPSDYCYVTAPWTYGYLFAIDLVFFDQFITVPEQIPEVYEAYQKFVGMRKSLLKGEDLAPYQYFPVPPDKGFCFSFNPAMPDKLPPLTSAMSSSLDILSYKELLKNKVALDLFKIIPMKIPLDKDNKQMAIPYKLAEEITQVIQSLLPENIKVFSSPFDSENIINADQAGRFDEIVGISNDTFYASSGFSKGLFGSKEIKQGTALQLSSNVDFNYASYHLYRQYENFINFQLSLKTKKYKFQVQMFGNSLNDAKEREMALSEMTLGNSGILDYYAAKGYEPFQVRSTLFLEQSLKLRDLMIPIQSMFNSKPNDGGRPEQTDIGDGGALSRDYGQSDSKNFSLTKCIYCGNDLNVNSLNNFCDEDCQELYAEYILEQV
jgi:hypothetical protein